MKLTQAEIATDIERLIPRSLYAKHVHLTYGDMAEVPELAEFADELRAAEADWHAAVEVSA